MIFVAVAVVLMLNKRPGSYPPSLLYHLQDCVSGINATDVDLVTMLAGDF